MAHDGQGSSGITWRELSTRTEANLCIAGSRLVSERGADEGQGWGFDEGNKRAMLNRRWSVIGPNADEVSGWYRQQLVARGWEVKASHPQTFDHPIGADWYERGTEKLTLRTFGRAEDRPWWTYWPPDEGRDRGLHYDITLSDASSKS
jgi:hypothetical protein